MKTFDKYISTIYSPRGLSVAEYKDGKAVILQAERDGKAAPGFKSLHFARFEAYSSFMDDLCPGWQIRTAEATRLLLEQMHTKDF